MNDRASERAGDAFSNKSYSSAFSVSVGATRQQENSTIPRLPTHQVNGGGAASSFDKGITQRQPSKEFKVLSDDKLTDLRGYQDPTSDQHQSSGRKLAQ
jgi:hypothetical protein|nr:hypothetical protein Q903MT_gene6177 [Picea sitchensis]